MTAAGWFLLANALGCYTVLRPNGGRSEAARVAALMAVPR